MLGPAMEDRGKMIRLVAVLGFVFLGLSQEAMAEDVIRLASIEYPPYTGEAQQHGGFINRIVREAYAKVGYQVNVRYYPWARATALARKGGVDGLVPIWKREDRKEWLYFSDPMPACEVVFFKRKDLDIVFDGKDYLALKPYRIGTGMDYADPEGFERVREQLHVQTVKEDIQNLGKLVAGRLDLVIMDRFVGKHLLETQIAESAGEFDYLQPSLSIEPNHVGISRKTPQARKKLEYFNRDLALLEKEGRIQAILKEHQSAR